MRSGLEVRARELEYAERLSGERAVEFRFCTGGGNNRVYRVATATAVYALKCYGPADEDRRDRLGHEFEALRFLDAAGIHAVVPRAIAIDRVNGCALYEWVEGGSVTRHDANDIDAMLAFIEGVHAARTHERAASLALATQAVLRRSDLLEQIDARLTALVGPDSRESGETELAGFLSEQLLPELEHRRRRAVTDSSDWHVSRAARTLSPSDFGFHNALRRPDGSLTFIDFEYFGWDDPVKLIADVLWHPAMELSAAERHRVLDGARRIFGDDPHYEQRLAEAYPLFGIRWVLIMLNEFIPHRWRRRAFARSDADWAAAKTVQLRKASATLARVRRYRESELLP